MYMISQADKAQRFLALHRPGQPLLMPNPWDLGSAKLLASLGFEALATTSSGFAATLGRNDGSVTRDEAMIHAAVIVAATELPVSADLENAYADDLAGVAETMRLAIEVGLAGASVEDFAGRAATASTTPGWRPNASRRPPRRPTRAPASWYSPPGRRTTCTATPTSPIPSPGCRPTRRPAPTSCTRRACAVSRTSASWSARWTGRSTCWPWRAHRPWPSWPPRG